MDAGKKYLKQIGNNIRKLRDAKDMSQQDLADYCDVAKSTIQRIEGGQMNPTILMLHSIAKSLNTSIESLIK